MPISDNALNFKIAKFQKIHLQNYSMHRSTNIPQILALNSIKFNGMMQTKSK